MRAAVFAALLSGLAAPAMAQPAPPAPPPATQQALGRGLFGEDEPQPGDEAAAEATDPLPEAPGKPAATTAQDKAYDQRVRQSYAAAEAFQGKLDGGWKVIGARGAALLDLQLIDKGKGEVEGAWRDLRSGPTPAASGLLDPTPVADGRLSASFFGNGLTYRLALARGADGRWTGRYWRGDEAFDVKMEKIGP
jgi:hypothetical protein